MSANLSANMSSAQLQRTNSNNGNPRRNSMLTRSRMKAGYNMTALDRELIRVEEVYQKITEDPKWNKKLVKLTMALMKFVEENDPHKKLFDDSYGLNFINDSTVTRS